MAQSGGRLRFPNETPEAILVADELRGQQFERDFAIKSGILSEIDLTHPARSEFF